MFIIGNLFVAIGKLLSFAIDAWIIFIFVRAVLSWFSVSPYSTVVRFLIAVTDPILEPMRRIIPRMAIDISPLIAIAALWFLDMFVAKSLIDIGRRLAMG
jgi:YggT family protein